MKTRKLGNAGPDVPAICLGGNVFGWTLDEPASFRVLDAAFDTAERQKFARQLTTGARLESEKLKGVVLLRDGQVWNHDAVTGCCRLIPKRGVMMVVTDAHKRETVFGFFQFPATLQDLNGKDVVTTHQGDRWTFQNFVNSPDSRFRQIVKRFTDAGYTDHEKDEFK